MNEPTRPINARKVWALLAVLWVGATLVYGGLLLDRAFGREVERIHAKYTEAFYLEKYGSTRQQYYQRNLDQCLKDSAQKPPTSGGRLWDRWSHANALTCANGVTGEEIKYMDERYWPLMRESALATIQGNAFAIAGYLIGLVALPLLLSHMLLFKGLPGLNKWLRS